MDILPKTKIPIIKNELWRKFDPQNISFFTEVKNAPNLALSIGSLEYHSYQSLKDKLRESKLIKKEFTMVEISIAAIHNLGLFAPDRTEI